MLLLILPALADDAYWRLRDRLATEFMVPDGDLGGMIPTSRRVDSTTSMKWSDATIQLGWWIGALALEQALLAQPDVLPGFAADGRTADDAARDLALALGALDRLDDHDPSAFPDCAGPWGLDGFFVRDDVPASITADFPGITTIESDWIDPVLTNKEMSQDQVIHVLVGLALVARYTDPALEVDGVGLRDQAVAATARIADIVAADGEWVIRNPGCEDRNVNRGDAAQFYSVPFADTFVAITGSTPDEGMFPDAWADGASPDYIAYTNHNNQHMAMALAATGNGWDDTTYASLVALAATHGWEAYPALHAALWGEPVDDAGVRERLAAQLAELGDGEPASPWPDGPGANGWTTWHRYITDSAGAYVGEEGSADYRFPGVDWLLAHNLYAAVYEAEWPVHQATLDYEGCACSSAPSPGLAAGVGVLALLRRR